MYLGATTGGHRRDDREYIRPKENKSRKEVTTRVIRDTRFGIGRESRERLGVRERLVNTGPCGKQVAATTQLIVAGLLLCLTGERFIDTLCYHTYDKDNAGQWLPDAILWGVPTVLLSLWLKSLHITVYKNPYLYNWTSPKSSANRCVKWAGEKMGKKNRERVSAFMSVIWIAFVLPCLVTIGLQITFLVQNPSPNKTIPDKSREVIRNLIGGTVGSTFGGVHIAHHIRALKNVCCSRKNKKLDVESGNTVNEEECPITTQPSSSPPLMSSITNAETIEVIEESTPKVHLKPSVLIPISTTQPNKVIDLRM